jgi:hypothetical protein
MILSNQIMRWTDPRTWPWFFYIWLLIILAGYAKPVWRWLQRKRAQDWPASCGKSHRCRRDRIKASHNDFSAEPVTGTGCPPPGPGPFLNLSSNSARNVRKLVLKLAKVMNSTTSSMLSHWSKLISGHAWRRILICKDHLPLDSTPVQ